MKLRVFLWDFEREFQGTSLPLESLEISNSGLPVSGTLSQKKNINMVVYLLTQSLYAGYMLCGNSIFELGCLRGQNEITQCGSGVSYLSWGHLLYKLVSNPGGVFRRPFCLFNVNVFFWRICSSYHNYNFSKKPRIARLIEFLRSKTLRYSRTTFITTTQQE